MNRSICEGCKRFLEKDDIRWYCSKKIRYVRSNVIPKHKYLERDELYVMAEARENPPSWCEFSVEQLVVEEEVSVSKYPESELVFDKDNTW